jgi:hypothetical protein
VYNANLTAIITNRTSSGSDLSMVYPTSLYTVTTDWTKNENTILAKPDGAAESTVTLTVTVTLNTNLTENIRGDFSLLINATTQADRNNTPV